MLLLWIGLDGVLRADTPTCINERPLTSTGSTTRIDEQPWGPITTYNKSLPPGLRDGCYRPQPQLTNSHGCTPWRTAMGAHCDKQPLGLITTFNKRPWVSTTTIDKQPIAPLTIPQPAPPPLSSLQALPHIPHISKHSRKTLVTLTQHWPNMTQHQRLRTNSIGERACTLDRVVRGLPTFD